MPDRLTRITTKGGDKGQSGLADGSRLPKAAPQFAALGDVDELNSAIGIVVANLPQDHELEPILIELQSRLFDIGGALATPQAQFSMTDEVAVVERWISEYNARLAPLANFVLPGGSLAGAHAHLARAVCRRAERTLWKLLAEHPRDYDSTLAVFLNRLSDALFVFARVLNLDSPERLWQQRKRSS